MSETIGYPSAFEGRARLASVAVFLAFVAVFFGTAAIYQIEDDNPLTGPAFEVVPLLGASLLSAHLAALAALVIVGAGAGQTALAMWRENAAPLARAFAFFFSAIVVVGAVGAFGLIVLYVRVGGSIVSALTGGSRAFSSFVAAAAFAAFIVAALATGREVVCRLHTATQDERRTDGILIFWAGAILAMLVNVLAAITHTIALRNGSPELFAESIDHVAVAGYRFTLGFYFSELVVANAVAAALTIGAAVFVARAVIEPRLERNASSREA